MSKRKFTNPKLDEEIDRLFATVDVNHNGTIDKNEFTDFMDRFFSHLHFKDRSNMIQIIFNKIDRDKNEVVDKEEIKSYIKENLVSSNIFDEDVNMPMKRSATGPDTVDAIRSIGVLFRNSLREIKNSNVDNSSVDENTYNSIYKESDENLFNVFQKNHQYDHLYAWESLEEQEHWCRSGVNNERDEKIERAIANEYLLSKKFFLTMPNDFLNQEKLRFDVYQSNERLVVKHLRNILSMNETLATKRDRIELYDDFIKIFYYEDTPMNSFMEETIGVFVENLFSQEFLDLYNDETVDYFFEILIYFWMTPKVDDLTPVRCVKRHIQYLLRNVSESMTEKDNSFVCQLLRAAQINTDRRQHLYWKLMTVILELDEYNENNDVYFQKKLLLYYKQNVKRPLLNNIFYDFGAYEGQINKTRSEVLAIQTFLFKKLTQIGENRNSFELTDLVEETSDKSLIYSGIWHFLAAMKKKDQNTFENCAICFINIMKGSLILAIPNGGPYLSSEQSYQIIDAVYEIFYALPEKMQIMMLQYLFASISIIIHTTETFLYNLKPTIREQLENLLCCALRVIPTKLEVGKGAMLLEAYELIKSCKNRVPDYFVNYIIEHMHCDLTLIQLEAKAFLLQREDLIEYVPKLGRSLLPFTRFDIESLVALGMKSNESFRYCFSAIKRVLNVLIKAFNSKNDEMTRQTATVALLPQLKYLLSLLKEEVRTNFHLSDVKKEFFPDILKEDSNEEGSLSNLLTTLYSSIDQSVINESLQKEFNELMSEIHQIGKAQIIPHKAPTLDINTKEDFYYPKSADSTKGKFLGRVVKPILTSTEAVIKIEDMAMEVDPNNPLVYYPVVSGIQELKANYTDPLFHYISPSLNNLEDYSTEIKVNNESYRYDEVRYPFQVHEKSGNITFTGSKFSNKYREEIDCIPPPDSSISLTFWKKKSTSYFDSTLSVQNEGAVGSGRLFKKIQVSLYDEYDNSLQNVFRDSVIEVDFNVNTVAEINEKIQSIYKIESGRYKLFTKPTSVIHGDWLPLIENENLRDIYNTEVAQASRYGRLLNGILLDLKVRFSLSVKTFEAWSFLERELKGKFDLNQTTVDFLKRIYDMKYNITEFTYDSLKKLMSGSYILTDNDWKMFQKLTKGPGNVGEIGDIKSILYCTISFLKPERGEKRSVDRKIELFKLLCQDKDEKNVYLKKSIENLYFDIDFGQTPLNAEEKRLELTLLPEKIEDRKFEEFLQNSSISHILHNHWTSINGNNGNTQGRGQANGQGYVQEQGRYNNRWNNKTNRNNRNGNNYRNSNDQNRNNQNNNGNNDNNNNRSNQNNNGNNSNNNNNNNNNNSNKNNNNNTAGNNGER